MGKGKIGLLSVYNYNYGSILQAYALQSVLIQLGYEAEIILYRKNNYFKQVKRLLYLPLLKSVLKMKWKWIYCKFFRRDMYNNVLLKRNQVFAQFIKENLKFSSVYVGRNALIQGCKKYDMFVLGSDQVWNPMNLGGDFYTMTFIPDTKKKVAYGPSFGVAKIPEKQRKTTSDYLRRINHLSVREGSGGQIVKELTGRDAELVVDPTILIERRIWDEKKGERIVEDEYIFCYFISNNASYRKFAYDLAQKTKLKIVAIPHVDEYVKCDEDYADIILGEIGPLQFINLISNANFVCTDSFHGTVFSTLYKRNFYTFSRYIDEGPESTNSRLYSFLDMIGMKNRIFDGEHKITDDDLWTIDFSQVSSRLEKWRNESMKFLISSLES